MPENTAQVEIVPLWALDICNRYGEKLKETGGNDPVELLTDFLRPSTDERPNNLMKVNIVRFLLAASVWAQVQLISTLERDGTIKKES